MSRNDVTGDEIRSKGSTERYRKGWDAIFAEPSKEPVVVEDIITANVVFPDNGEKENSK